MSSTINIFVTGATGYLGGSVVSRLLEHPKAGSFKITALVRSQEKADKLKTLGIKTVLGSLSDLDTLTGLASEADVIFTVADADDLNAAQAVLRGIKNRHEATGKAPILIHVSGTGVLIDDAKGIFASETIYNDTDVAQIESLPPTALHRNVDLAIVAADEAGYARTHIILPPTIYGLANGKLVDIGAQNRHSIQIPGFIKYTIARGEVGIVGEGKNIWPNVALGEVVDLFIILFDSIFSNPVTTGHGREGFYFAENGEFTHYEAVKAIQAALAARGIGKLAEPTPFTEQDYKQMPLILSFGTNSRSRADRSRALGWRPTKTTKDMLESIQPEVDALLSLLQKV